MITNDLTGYYDSSMLPGNAYQDAKLYGPERRQTNQELSMADYNNQVHEAELLKQRQWSLEDRDYNSPAEMRKRLEDAGYNPALMSGAIQTANAPVRVSTANSPTASVSNMSGYENAKNQTGSNLIEAGKSLFTAMMTQKQMQAIDSQINLQNSQGIETLSRAAKTDTERKQMSDLFTYQKDALIQNIALMKSNVDLNNAELSQVIPMRLAQMQKGVQLQDAQIENMAKQLEINKNLTKAEIASIRQNIQESASRILNNNQTLEVLKNQVANGSLDLAIKMIEREVRNVTKYADMAAPYVNIVTEGISTALGLSKAGMAAKALQQGQQNFDKTYEQRERMYTPNSHTDFFDYKGNRTGSTSTYRTK